MAGQKHLKMVLFALKMPLLLKTDRLSGKNNSTEACKNQMEATLLLRKGPTTPK